MYCNKSTIYWILVSANGAACSQIHPARCGLPTSTGTGTGTGGTGVSGVLIAYIFEHLVYPLHNNKVKPEAVDVLLQHFGVLND